MKPSWLRAWRPSPSRALTAISRLKNPSRLAIRGTIPPFRKSFMRSTSFKAPRFTLALLASLVCASAPFLAHAESAYEFRQSVPALGVRSTALSLSTSAIDFGNVATNTTETRQVLVSSSGTTALRFTADPAVTGAAFAAGATTCSSTLAAGADCLTEATFSPTTVGDFSGTLTFFSNVADSPHPVSLRGSAYNPVSLSAATLPAAAVNVPYGPFNFASLFNALNESSPDFSQVLWSATGVPAGLTLSASGVLTGTPTAAPSSSLQVTAKYKSNLAAQSYVLPEARLVYSTLSNGLLTVSGYGGQSGAWVSALGTTALTKGKWYWEMHLPADSNGKYRLGGIATAGSSAAMGQGIPSWTGCELKGFSVGPAWGCRRQGGVLMLALDMDAKTLTMGENGVWWGAGTSTSTSFAEAAPILVSLPSAVYPYAKAAWSGSLTVNFGASPFSYPVPAGYTPGVGAWSN